MAFKKGFMNALSRQLELALSAPSERLRDFWNSVRIDNVNLPLSAVSDEAWTNLRRRVRIIYNPETARASSEPVQILNGFIPPRFKSLDRNIMAALKHAPRYALARKLGAFESDVNEAEKAAIDQNLLDQRAVLAGAQHTFNTECLTPSQAGFQLGLYCFGRLDKPPTQFIRRGVMETRSPRSTKPFECDLIRVEKSDAPKQSLKTRITRQSCFSSPIRTANDPELSVSHKAAGYELGWFRARAFPSVNAAMSSEVNSSDSGSIGCCRSIKKRTKSSASCCKRGGSALAPSKICSATLIVQSYHGCGAMSPLFQYPAREISYFCTLATNYQPNQTNQTR